MKKSISIIDLYDKKGLTESQVKCLQALVELAGDDGVVKVTDLAKKLKWGRTWLWTALARLQVKNLVKSPTTGVYYPTVRLS